MAWVGTSGGGISGAMIRDMMLDCVERRFEALRALQQLADNGSAYTAGEPQTALARKLAECRGRPTCSPASSTPCSRFR